MDVYWASAKTLGALSTIHWTERALPAMSANSRPGSADRMSVATQDQRDGMRRSARGRTHGQRQHRDSARS